ncbi:MAG: chemotaxis protein [Epsilonproteobacteria bacterium]|nr:chemotaxis protein [Campylobacterota bacterium]
MTQEELDALMAGELDDMQDDASDALAIDESEAVEDTSLIDSDVLNTEKEKATHQLMQEYRTSSTMSWPPPPPTDDHKMVHQLDDVTKDSELKATQVFDKLETINNFMMGAEENAKEVIKQIESNITLFETLVNKFPKIEQFQKALDDNHAMKERMEDILMNAQMAEDEVMMTMDVMQYQDIHRQKIERVINVMRALSKYMNALFEGKKDDDKRVSSAVHIHGDTSTEDVVTSEDIEALIASLGKK